MSFDKWQITGTGIVEAKAVLKVHEVSATKAYPYGTLARDCHRNELYRYAKFGDTVLTNRLAWGFNYQYSPQSAIGTTSALGADHIHVTIGAHDGEPGSHDGAIAADELVGGTVVIFHADASVLVYGITANTVVASGGGACTITLDNVLQAAVTAGVEVVEIMANPYIDIRTGNNGGLRPFLGVPMGPGTATLCNGWIKRRGWAFVAPQSTVGTSMHGQVVARHDGSIDSAIGGQGPTDAWTQNMQHIGYVGTWALAGTQGAPFIWLMLE